MCAKKVRCKQGKILPMWERLPSHRYIQLEDMLRAILRICNGYVLQTLLYVLKVWGGSVSPSTWNDIEEMQTAFLRHHLGVKINTPFLVLLLETWRRPIEFHALMWVMQYIIQVQQMPNHKFSKKAWDASMKLQKNHKSKIQTIG